MSRVQSLLVGLLAVLTFSGASSASASAFSYLILGGWLNEPEKFASTNLTKAVLSSPSAAIETLCQTLKITGTIELSGLGTYHFSLTECQTTTPPSCRIKEPVLFSGVHHLVLKPAGTLATLFLASKPNGVFVEIEYENNGGECAYAGVLFPLEGTLAAIAEGKEAHSLVQQLNFTNASSSLSDAGLKFSFKALQDVVLNSDRIWGAMMV
jgi:hypothetical protein